MTHAIFRSLLMALIWVAIATPALADDADPMAPDDSAPTTAAPAAPNAAELQSQFGGIEKQLKSPACTSSGDPSLPHMMHVVQALKNGGKGVTAEDIKLLRGYLTKIGADNTDPTIGPMLDLLGQQLETVQHQMANPDEDPLKALGID